MLKMNIMKLIRARFAFARLCGLAVLGLACFVPGSRAADATDTNYTGVLWSPEPSAAILRAAADITTNQYPDSDSATVDCRSVRVYRPDGTGACQDESFVKVLTEKGRRDNRTLSLNLQHRVRPVARGHPSRRLGVARGRRRQFQRGD
jgi:hypothetical protein